MHTIRFPIWLAMVAFLSFSIRAEQAVAAAPSAETQAQTGKTAQVRLLKVGRLLDPQSTADGMGFLFLVMPATAASSGFAIKETRDFLLGGASYQEKSEAELGRRLEPGTQVMGAEKFFTDNPALKPAGIVEIPKGSFVISLTIRGAKIAPAATAAITLHVGYEKQVEEFTFSVPVPAP